MPVRNALAAASLGYTTLGPGSFNVTLKIWSHSYDDPDPARRNAVIKKVLLTGLTGGPSTISNAHITDRYGVDQTALWKPQGGVDVGWGNYTELGPVKYGATTINVVWGSHSGIYDERCALDLSCDAMRLQTYPVATHGIAIYNYMIGPMTFAFDFAHNAAPNAVKLTMGYIGGNNGIPAQRFSTLPDEEFVIAFP